MKELALHEKTWLAAAIDGEGSVGASRVKHKTSKRLDDGMRYQIITRIRIFNTNPEFCKRALEITGIGKFRLHDKKRGPTGNGQRPCFTWETAKQKEILPLLEQLLPYLIVKREKAKLVLEYIRLRNGRGKNAHLNDEWVLVEKMKLMNVKGVRQ